MTTTLAPATVHISDHLRDLLLQLPSETLAHLAHLAREREAREAAGTAGCWQQEVDRIAEQARAVRVARRDGARGRLLAGSGHPGSRGTDASSRDSHCGGGRRSSPRTDGGGVVSAEPTPLRGLAGIPDVAGDHLNAKRFLDTYGGKVRRSPELGRWYVFNGAWWDEDRLDRVPDMAADCIDQLREWVAQADSADEFKRRTHHYTASAKAGRRDALLSIAGTDPDVVVAVEQLDAHPMLLACRNGTVDLTTGDLRPAQPDDLLTRGVDVDYEPDADTSEWEKFIETTFAGESDLISFVQRLLGYCTDRNRPRARSTGAPRCRGERQVHADRHRARPHGRPRHDGTRRPGDPPRP